MLNFTGSSSGERRLKTLKSVSASSLNTLTGKAGGERIRVCCVHSGHWTYLKNRFPVQSIVQALKKETFNINKKYV